MLKKTQPQFCFKETAPLFFAILIDILGFGLVYPVLTALFTTSHTMLPEATSNAMRLWYLGIGFTLYPLCMFFGSSFMGDLSDRWGRKRVILLCMGGLVIGFGLMGISIVFSSLFLLFLGRAISGLMSASMPVVLAAIADLSSGRDKAVHMSYVALIQSAGFVLGPLMGGILSDQNLVSNFNFSLPFFTSALLSLLAFFWILFFFQESFVATKEKGIDFLRILKVFVQAARQKKIRILSIAFFLMQVGISLYLQLILLYYKEKFDYSVATMGIFNAYLGFWFALGLLLIVPYAVRRFAIEQIAATSLLITAISQIGVAIISNSYMLWVVAIPLALAVQVGFTAMLTSFSNAATKEEQGWAMGITGALIALSFTVTGFSPNLVPFLGVKSLIFLGGCLLGIGYFAMHRYNSKFF